MKTPSQHSGSLLGLSLGLGPRELGRATAAAAVAKLSFAPVRLPRSTHAGCTALGSDEAEAPAARQAASERASWLALETNCDGETRGLYIGKAVGPDPLLQLRGPR